MNPKHIKPIMQVFAIIMLVTLMAGVAPGAVFAAAATITFGDAPTPTYLGGNFIVSALTTNTDSGTLTYSVSSGPCAWVSGSTFSSTGAGTCIVQASGIATTNFDAASGTQSITIAQATPTVSFGLAPTPTYQGAAFSVSAATTTTDSVTLVYSLVDGPCLFGSGATFTSTGAGTCIVRATSAATTNFKTASQTQSVTIAKAAAVITFGTIPTQTYLGGDFTVSTNILTTNLDSSTLTYSKVSGPCTFVSGATFRSTGAGTCVVQADGIATTNFNAASQTKSVTIGLATPAITFGTAPTPIYLGGNFTVTASSTNTDSGTLTYSKFSGPCTFVSVATFSSTGAGACVVQASGSVTTNFNAASQTQTVTIAKSAQTIAFTSTSPSKAVVGGTTYTPTATGGGSLNAVVFTIDGTAASICTISSGVVSFLAVGTCVINANQAANTDYNAATQIQQSFAVTVIKVMTAFSIMSPEVAGVINESAHTIAVTVPFGTDVTALAARFTSTGLSVKIGVTTQVSGSGTPINFTSPVTYRVIAADASYQDYTVTVTIAPSPMKSIISFGFVTPSAKGEMTGPSGTIIKVTVPFGTNVAALVASFTTTGASVKVGTVTQVSGTTAVNFTNPVTYMVTAANASTKTYSVIVTVAGKSTKEITAFSFPRQAATGVFNGTDIAVTVPFGTNVRALIATFTTTGSMVKVGAATQVSGITKTSFSNPAIYTVIAEDGSKQTYKVRVTVAPKIIKFITAFSFTNPAATGVITEAKRTIAVTVPFGTDVTALVASFTTTDISPMVGTTAQISGTTPNNFSGTVSYKLSDMKIYKVTVKVAASPAKDMTAFSFSKQAAIGVISGTNIAVTVPAGTNVKALVARFSTTGASVKIGTLKQVSGSTKNNFTSPVLYKVTAADASTQIYTVTVTVMPKSSKDITAFSFTSPAATGVISGTSIAVTVPFGTNVNALIASFTTTGASVKIDANAQTSGTTPNNFTSPLTYRVTAADASTKDYIVTVTVAINPANKDITAFSFTSPSATGAISGTSIAVTVPFGTNVNALVASFTTTGSSVKNGASVVQTSGTTANNFTSPLTYIVTAADASTKSYIVTVTVAANPAKDITTFSFTSPAATGVITGTSIVLMVPFGTNPFGLVANFTTTGGSVKVGSMSQTSGTTANNFTSPVTYTVTAADTSTQDYTVTVIVAAK